MKRHLVILLLLFCLCSFSTSLMCIDKTLLEIEIARFGSDGILQVTKWIDEPVEIIAKIGNEAVTYSRNGVQAVDELYLVGKNGKVGVN